MTPTSEQIAEWKAKYGIVYKINTEDGREAYIKDPLSDLTIMKAAVVAHRKSAYDYVKSVLENCWLAGNESIKTDEAVCMGLEDNISEFTQIPNCVVEKKGSVYIVKVEGYEVKVRAAKRVDIQMAEQRNLGREPFETAVHLLNRIAVDGVADKVRQENSRAYIGLLAGIDEVKDSAVSSVEKL